MNPSYLYRRASVLSERRERDLLSVRTVEFCSVLTCCKLHSLCSLQFATVACAAVMLRIVQHTLGSNPIRLCSVLIKAPRGGFELPRPGDSGFRIHRNTRLCDLGLQPAHLHDHHKRDVSPQD
jgi:hypothetical protein